MEPAVTHRRPVQAVSFVLAASLATAVLTGCVHHRFVQVACAATIESASAPASSGGSHSSPSSSHSSSSSGARSTPSHTIGGAKPNTSAKSGAAKPPTGQNTPSKTPEKGDPAPAVKANSAKAPASQRSKVSPPGEKSYTPPPADVKPPAKQVQAAQRSAPAQVSLAGSYRSPVTHHVYVFHDAGWYGSPGYVLDIFDPYNPFNYYSNALSPFYGRPYVLVNQC
jgi:hypothetical protein